jgi:hypothetical protein
MGSAHGAIGDDLGGGLVITLALDDEGSPEIALIAYRATLEAVKRHICRSVSPLSLGRPGAFPKRLPSRLGTPRLTYRSEI